MHRWRGRAPFTRELIVAATFVALAWGSGADAEVVAIPPFAGEYSDNFNSLPLGAAQAVSVLQSRAILRNLSDGGAIKVELSSSLNGDLVTPLSGRMVGQLGIAEWSFSEPMRRFGAYFENNSGADDATLSFFGAGDVLLGTVVADVPVSAQAWTWNGWESSVPFERIEVVGNGLINGFIWYENAAASVVPEPSGGILLAAATVLLGTRRRRTRTPTRTGLKSGGPATSGSAASDG